MDNTIDSKENTSRVLKATFFMKKNRWYSEMILFIILSTSAIFGGIIIIHYNLTNEYNPTPITWFRYILAFVVIIPAVFILQYYLKFLFKNNNLLIYTDGFVLPTNDFEGLRLKPIFIENQKIAAIWFWTERDRLKKLPGKGINLGVNPLSIWGEKNCILFNVTKESIPKDIILVRLGGRLIDFDDYLTTGAMTLVNGEDAMRTLIISILESHKIKY